MTQATPRRRGRPPKKRPTVVGEMLNMREVAFELGISVATLYRFMDEEYAAKRGVPVLPVTKFGRRRVSRADLVEWVKASRHGSGVG